jgi:hypothetical protein
MRYVIIRDDDTNALTPVECLERLYRPFLDRGLPVNLATIPEVSLKATMDDGRKEGFLVKGHAISAGRSGVVYGLSPERQWDSCEGAEGAGSCVPLAANRELTAYLHAEPGYHFAQHGCHHDYLEFDCSASAEVVRRLERGKRKFLEAGFSPPRAFVAPYDKLSRAAMTEVARRFRVLSTGWYELRRVPYSWWPGYALKKLRRRSHWRIGGTLLLSHPGCILSCQHTYCTMLGAIFHYLQTEQLTVLVTHWWEYFRDGQPDEPFIDLLHETACYLATEPHLKVISFDDLASGQYPLN